MNVSQISYQPNMINNNQNKYNQSINFKAGINNSMKQADDVIFSSSDKIFMVIACLAGLVIPCLSRSDEPDVQKQVAQKPIQTENVSMPKAKMPRKMPNDKHIKALEFAYLDYVGKPKKFVVGKNTIAAVNRHNDGKYEVEYLVDGWRFTPSSITEQSSAVITIKDNNYNKEIEVTLSNRTYYFDEEGNYLRDQ